MLLGLLQSLLWDLLGLIGGFYLNVEDFLMNIEGTVKCSFSSNSFGLLGLKISYFSGCDKDS